MGAQIYLKAEFATSKQKTPTRKHISTKKKAQKLCCNFFQGGTRRYLIYFKTKNNIFLNKNIALRFERISSSVILEVQRNRNNKYISI